MRVDFFDRFVGQDDNRSKYRMVMGKRHLVLIAIGSLGLAGSAISASAAEMPLRNQVGSARKEAAKSPEAQRAFDHRNSDQLPEVESRQVRHGDKLMPLPAGMAIDAGKPVVPGSSSIDQFMADNSVVGFMAIKDGKVLAERYRLGNHPKTLWEIQSNSKSVTSTLVGAAIKDGFIGSVDDPVVRYIPELKDSAYDGATLRNLLQMSSGVALHDSYDDPESDYAKLQRAYEDPAPDAVLNFIKTLHRAAAPGTVYSYNGTDTFVLGLIVARVTKETLAGYLSRKIWAPVGMEYDASWNTDANGNELAAGGLRVTLRDMARFGIFVVNNGRIGKTSVVPAEWFAQASAAVPGDRLAPSAIKGYEPMGYGYQWWTMGREPDAPFDLGAAGTFAAMGVYGQQLYVVPSEKLVVVVESAWDNAVELDRVTKARELVSAIAKATHHP